MTSLKKTVVVSHTNCVLLLIENLQPFFQALGEFQLAYASSVLSKKTELCKSAYWSELIQPFQLLIECEKTYYSMTYLTQKKAREELIQSLKAIQKQIKAFDQLLAQLPSKVQQECEPQIKAATRLLQEAHLIPEHRIDMIALYQFMSDSFSSKLLPSYDEMLLLTQQITGKYEKEMKANELRKIKDAMLMETSMLRRLFEIEIHLLQYKYRESMLSLALYKNDLSEWNKTLLAHTRSFGKLQEEKKATTPAMAAWCSATLSFLIGKSTLYFFSILRDQAIDMKEDVMQKIEKLEINHIAAIDKFVKKSGASFVGIFVDSEKMNTIVNAGEGYKCETAETIAAVKSRSGLERWPFIFLFPLNETPLKHKTHLADLVTFTQADRDSFDKGKCIVYPEQKDTFMVQQIERNIFVCVIYPGCRKSSDVYQTDFTSLASRIMIWPSLTVKTNWPSGKLKQLS
eukprot:TRINITY_DN2174_c0_g1_i1.p1 TRINITY_DN2174_c0_g1~~TRINITY_DN2174_c0_g1_i1.p1  ORF type:complete len:458 (-),score=89.15 TRINITY_DN2174_c0_g1_i1:16-1389(-)